MILVRIKMPRYLRLNAHSNRKRLAHAVFAGTIAGIGAITLTATPSSASALTHQLIHDIDPPMPTHAPVARVSPHIVDGILTNAAVSTRAELEELFTKPGPMHGTMSTTGEVLEVWVGEPPASRALTEASRCAPTDLCLFMLRIPLTDIGFSGTGRRSGRWEQRGGWTTGNRDGRVEVGFDIVNQTPGGWTAWWPPGWTWNFNTERTTVITVERR